MKSRLIRTVVMIAPLVVAGTTFALDTGATFAVSTTTDIELKSITLTPPTPTQGQPFTVAATIRNSSTSPVDLGKWWLRLRATTSEAMITYCACDTSAGAVGAEVGNSGSLGSGTLEHDQTMLVQRTMTLPEAGPWKITAKLKPAPYTVPQGDSNPENNQKPVNTTLALVSPVFGCFTPSGGYANKDQVKVCGNAFAAIGSTVKPEIWFGGAKGTVVSSGPHRVDVRPPLVCAPTSTPIRIVTSAGESTSNTSFSIRLTPPQFTALSLTAVPGSNLNVSLKNFLPQCGVRTLIDGAGVQVKQIATTGATLAIPIKLRQSTHELELRTSAGNARIPLVVTRSG